MDDNPVNRRDPSGLSYEDMAAMCPAGTELTNSKPYADGSESGSCTPVGGGNEFSQEIGDALNAMIAAQAGAAQQLYITVTIGVMSSRFEGTE